MIKNAASHRVCTEPEEVTLQRYLKQVTLPLHAKTEKVFDLKRRIASLAGYRDALVVLYRLHDELGRALQALDWEEIVVDFDRSRQRLGWLRTDLAYFGIDVASLAPGQRLVLADKAEGLGCLYVIEGSMLGGAFINRAIQQRLGITEASGGRFFGGFGDTTDAAWSTFVATLDSHPVSVMGSRAAIGAGKTFDLFAAMGTSSISL